MEQSNEPPSWAATPAPRPQLPPPDETKNARGTTPIVLAFLGGVALTALIVGAFFIGRSSTSNDDVAEDDEQIDVTTTEAPVETTEAPVEEPEPESTTTTEAPEPDEGEAAESEVDTVAGTDGNRIAYLSGGVLRLEGAVPSDEIAGEIAARAGAILGEENVVNNYTIDPDIPFADSGPLVVEDLILFPTSSSQINPAFAPLLDLGTNLLTQFPNVTITVVSHTDAVGPADANLALSQQRGDAVAAYWIERGIDASRITVDARGESDLLVPTDGAEQANRRAEFIITGLLG